MKPETPDSPLLPPITASTRIARADRPSKTRLKAEMSARQDLGENLADLPAELFSRLDCAEELIVALKEARRMRAHEARRRQIQFIGKVLRHMDDEEFAALETHYLALTNGQRLDTRLLHQAEAWRDALLAGDSAAKSQLASLPQAQQDAALASLAPAQNESRNGVYGQHTRALFKQLRLGLEILANPSLPIK